MQASPNVVRLVGRTSEQMAAVDLTESREIPNVFVDNFVLDFDPVPVGFVEGLEDRDFDGVELVDDASEARRSRHEPHAGRPVRRRSPGNRPAVFARHLRGQPERVQR